MSESPKELAGQLRRLADAIEGLPDGMCVKSQLWVHRINTLPNLQAISRLMETVTPSNTAGNPWISGKFESIDVDAFYTAGLLGTIKNESIKVIDHEETDISPLLVGREQKVGE